MLQGRLAEVRPSDVDTGWGGEALGKGKAAMTIEGNWISGAMKRLPERQVQGRRAARGPGRQGHPALQQLLGHRRQAQNQAAGGRPGQVPHHDRAADGLRRRLRRHALAPRTAAKAYAAKYPESQAFVAGAQYAQGPVNVARLRRGAGQFNSQLATMGTHGDPKRARRPAEERHGRRRRSAMRPPPLTARRTPRTRHRSPELHGPPTTTGRTSSRPRPGAAGPPRRRPTGQAACRSSRPAPRAASRRRRRGWLFVSPDDASSSGSSSSSRSCMALWVSFTTGTGTPTPSPVRAPTSSA